MSRLEDAAARHKWAAEENRLAYEDLIKESLQAHQEGMSIKRIAEISGVSRWTLHKYQSAALSANLRALESD